MPSSERVLTRCGLCIRPALVGESATPALSMPLCLTPSRSLRTKLDQIAYFQLWRMTACSSQAMPRPGPLGTTFPFCGSSRSVRTKLFDQPNGGHDTLQAFDNYPLGGMQRKCWNQLDREGMRRSIEIFEHAFFGDLEDPFHRLGL